MVKNWLGEEFYHLHPTLQSLHLTGGKLNGNVQVVFGKGIAGYLAQRLADKLNIPNEGQHTFAVNISHSHEGLHWDRCFKQQQTMRSVFKPIGNIQEGYWVEKTGPIYMHLTVDVKQGAWHWRCLKFKFGKLRLPLFLFPKSKAYKTIEKGKYRFYVGFSLPILGTFLSYSGLLEIP